MPFNSANPKKTSTILLIEKDPRLRQFWKRVFQREGFQTWWAKDSEEAIQKSREDSPEMILLGSDFDSIQGLALLKKLKEINPRLNVIIPSQSRQLKEELLSTRESPLAFKVEPIQLSVKSSDELKTKKIDRLRARGHFENLVGQSRNMEEVLEATLEVASSDKTTVLIQGETGTGKEEVAKAIHQNSPRASKPFLVISCTAVPENLLESELFGHEEGAFTDAKKMKKGLLELADGGTLLLDEIGDMPLSLQAKILSVLENKRFRRLGGTQDIQVDVRMISATHRDLKDLVKKGAFREDLFYRLNVFQIKIAPLRQRKEDLVSLTQFYISKYNQEMNKKIKGLTFTAQKKIFTYDWPGNVREFKNAIERAMILAKGEFLSPDDLVLSTPQESKDLAISLEDLNLERLEARLVQEALSRSGGNQTQAAKLLGITRFALRNRLKKLKAKSRL